MTAHGFAAATMGGGARGVLGPEETLLFLAAAPTSSGPAAARVVADGVQWQRLSQLADAEGASGPLYHSLRKMQVEMPEDLASSLHSFAVVSEFRLMHVRRLLERTTQALLAGGIEVMLVKGAALAPFVYADLAERNMADLDIIVPASQAGRAQEIARGLGWLAGPAESLSAGYESHHHLPPLTDADGVDVRLEIHTDAFPTGQPLRYTLDHLRARSRRVAFAGGFVSVPSLEDLLLYSCVHLAWSHEMRVGGWKTFRDVSEIVGQPGFSWPRFLELAREPTVASSAYWTLRLSSRVSGVQVPDEVLHALRPALWDGVLNLVERHFVMQLAPLSRGSPSVWLNHLMWNIGMRPERSGHRDVRPWLLAERRSGVRRGVGDRWWLQPRGYLEALAYLRRLASPRR